VYKYDKVHGRAIGKGWLADVGNTKDGQSATTVQQYREMLLAAMGQARDQYVKRKRAEGAHVAKSITKAAQAFQDTNLKTINPEIPDFSSKRSPMHKFKGGCLPSTYQRFFTVD